MTTMTTLNPTVSQATPSAVVWIDATRAVVACVEGDGDSSTCDITRGSLHESQYLGQVIRVIGDRRRVMILGPDSARLALEREYVAVFHRLERLVDVEPTQLVGTDELLERARTLADTVPVPSGTRGHALRH